MGITEAITKIKKTQFSTVHLRCEKCSYGRVLTGTPIEIGRMKKEWLREHAPHDKQSTLQKFFAIFGIILDKVVSAIHKEISKR